MTTSIFTFTPDTGAAVPVRAKQIAGVTWFILSDVCRVLDIGNVGNAAARLDDDEKGNIRNPDATSVGGNPNITVVTESGLYSLILTSRKPDARRFRRWVTSDVLPAIRKDGGYVTGQEKVATGELSEEEFMARAVIFANNALTRMTAERDAARVKAEQLLIENVALEGTVEEMEPKAAQFDHYMDCDGTHSLRETAKVLRVPEKAMVRWMLSEAVLYRDARQALAPYQTHITARRFVMNAGTRAGGIAFATIRVTPEGVGYLARKFAERGTPLSPPPRSATQQRADYSRAVKRAMRH